MSHVHTGSVGPRVRGSVGFKLADLQTYRPTDPQTGNRQSAIGNFFVCGLLLLSAACVPSVRITYDPMWVPPSGTTYDDSSWQTVLDARVRDGLVDYRALAADPVLLNRYVGLISVVGPETTPHGFATPSDRMCYYINAYNACVVRGVLEIYPTPTVYRLDTPSFLDGFRFRLDGREVTLRQIREKLESACEGDLRVLLCLSSAALGSPELAAQAYRPNRLRLQMREAVRKFASNPHLVSIDSSKRVVYLWLDMMIERQKFQDYLYRLSGSRSGSMLDLLIQLGDPATRRRLASSREFAERHLAFNRQLNDQALQPLSQGNVP